MTLEAIKAILEQIEGKWNGEDKGVEEDNAMTAKEGLEALSALEDVLTKLGLNQE